MLRWPDRTTAAASAWAALYALALTTAALAAGRAVLNVASLTWPAVAVLSVGAILAAVTRSARSARVPARALTVGLWVVAAAGLAASCWILLDLVSLVVTGRVEGPDGTSNWGTFLE